MNELYIKKALVALYRLQTLQEKESEHTVEKNSAGFNAYDAKFGSSLAQQVLVGRQLSPKQMAAAEKMLAKYSRQLEVVGVETVTLPSPEEAAKKSATVWGYKKVGLLGEEVVARFDYDAELVSMIKHIYGAKWNANDKYWSFGRISPIVYDCVVNSLIPMGFEVSRELLEIGSELSINSEKVRRAASLVSVEEIDELGELNEILRPFQKAGVNFLIANGGRAILADEMGLGKTLQAIAFARASGSQKILVVCPATLKYTWAREIKKFVGESSSVVNGNEVEIGDRWTIINYDLIKKHLNLISQVKWDLLVVDEAHYIKNLKAQRTKILHSVKALFSKVLLLTGTPMLNRPIEMFSLLNFIQPNEWKNYFGFGKQYCSGYKGRWGWDFSGVSNSSDLKNRLSTVMLRRLKKDVLPELPDKQRQDIIIKLSPQTRKDYDAAQKDLINWLVKQKELDAAERASKAEQLVKVNYLKQIPLKDKVEAAREFIDNVVDNDKKIVVFSQYLDPLGDLSEIYGDKAVSLTGDDDSKSRDLVQQRFQNEDSVKIFLGSLKAAGFGLTLTAADVVLFLDLDWVPNNHKQAEDRLHRMGQKNSVNVYRLIAEDTIDERISVILDRKLAVINDIVAGDSDDQRKISVFDEFKKHWVGEDNDI